jgi:hypothetical protein
MVAPSGKPGKAGRVAKRRTIVPYSIAALKVAQDNHKAREAALLERFHEFRDGLFARIDQFAQDAIAAGLEDVSRCTRKKVAGDTIEVRCRVPMFDLVFIASDSVRSMKPDRDTLAARVLVYPEYHDDATPFVDVIVEERSEGGHLYKAQYFLQNDETRPLRSGTEVSQHTGPLVADSIIEFVYSYRAIWTERPTLKGMTTGEGSEGSWGFVSEKTARKATGAL